LTAIHCSEDGNWDAISIDSNPLLRRPSKLIASRFPTHTCKLDTLEAIAGALGYEVKLVKRVE